jgi:NAD(P)-dependent dehydrogenase (short-subunit alcohol dehydrogenase family)
MRERKWGRIVFISSESGLLTPVEMVNYGITKAAQAALARGLAREFGGCGVTVNAVLPGPTRTEGISTMLENESKRTGKSVRELEQEFFLRLAQLRSFNASQNPKRWQPWSSTPAAILRVPLLARLCGSKAASSPGSVKIHRLALSSAVTPSRLATGRHQVEILR